MGAARGFVNAETRMYACMGMIATEEEGLIGPAPNLFDKVGHVDLFVLDVLHPWMVQHPPRRGSSWRVFFEARQQTN
jgi:hypothetical protein